MKEPALSPVLALVLTLAGVPGSWASPPAGPKFDPGYRPAVSWNAAGPITRPLYPILDKGELAFVTVELSVDGHDGWFVVDTGSSRTWFTSAFTRSLGMRVSGQRIAVQGAGGSKRHDLVVFDAIDFGFVRLEPLWVISADVMEDVNRSLRSRGDQTLAGLVALDVLGPLGASVDLTRFTITFSGPAPAVAPPPATGHP